jgi:hypothetical protein
LEKELRTSHYESREPDFQVRLLQLSRISGLHSAIEADLAAAGITPTLRLDLSLWNRSRLEKLLQRHPLHLIESRSGVLHVIGGFRIYALARALAVKQDDPEVLAFIYRAKLSTTRRKEIIEEEIFALPAFFRHLPGEAQAVFKLYFEQFRPRQPGAMISADSQGAFYRATGFDRRSIRPHKTGPTPEESASDAPAPIEGAGCPDDL